MPGIRQEVVYKVVAGQNSIIWSFGNFEANAWPDSVWAFELTSMRPSRALSPWLYNPRALAQKEFAWIDADVEWAFKSGMTSSLWPESITRSSTSHSRSNSMIMTTRHSVGNREALSSVNNMLQASARATPSNEGGCWKCSAERLIIIWNKLKHLDCSNCLKSLCHIYTWLVFYITTFKSKTFEKFQSLCFEVIESSGREQCRNKAY